MSGETIGDPTGYYRGRRVLVGGAGVSGVAVAKALLTLGAEVIVANKTATSETTELHRLGAELAIAPEIVPDGVDEVVVSPGWPPNEAMVLDAATRGIDVYSEPELAWRLRPPGAAPWLAVTGTNGKTTTVTMLAAMLRAAGRRAIACGNVGYPLLSAVLDPNPYDVLAVELSSFQLHWSSRLAPPIAALLNVDDDHLDWHGDFPTYALVKTQIWRRADIAIGNADDSFVAAALADTPNQQISFTLDEPVPGQFGVHNGSLVDATGAAPVLLAPVELVRPAGRHNVANALAAAALARSYGVEPGAVADGLAGYQPQPHRNALIAEHSGVRWVNDSKGTNPHATAASVSSFESVVWIAGGLLKGVDIDPLVRTIAPRLAGAVVLGQDRRQILEALGRHAPALPVTEITSTDDGAMTDVVAAAAKLAHSGDTVLLSPAGASWDMFANYGARGAAFVAAVHTLLGPAALPESDVGSAPGTR